jgi:hypothetical protein
MTRKGVGISDLTAIGRGVIERITVAANLRLPPVSCAFRLVEFAPRLARIVHEAVAPPMVGGAGLSA